MSFQVVGLASSPFEHLFGREDDYLAQHHARRMVADAQPGFPCRITLQDAEPGKSLLLLPFMHQPAPTPYQATGPIFVEEFSATAVIPPGVVPQQLAGRLLSVRAYDSAGMMTTAEVLEGLALAGFCRLMFARKDVAYLHAHFARRGCYAARIDRLEPGKFSASLR